MVEKIFISPGNVRGLGNIVSVKTGSDFSGNYANIVQLEDGDFILSYEGLLLKFSTRLDNTIKDMTAYLYCTVLLEEDNSPVSDLIVSATYEDGTVLTETTDSDGEVTFTWTPLNLGNEVVTLSCEQQGDYASHSSTVDIRIGLFLNFYEIMTGLTLEDDELYEGTYETNIEHRSQLSTYISDIFVAEGGERCIARDGLVYVANTGDLVVEYSNLDQDDDYGHVIFEEEVDDLVGAVCGMSIDSNEDIVLTRLERSDIVGDAPVVDSVGLVSSDSSVSMTTSVTLSATVLDEDSQPLEDVSVSFLEDNVSLGTALTNSSGVATWTYHPSSAGSHSLTARAGGVTSSAVSVSAYKLQPAFQGVTVSPTSCYVGDSVTVSGTLATGRNVPVLIYDGSTLLDTVYTSSNHFSASVSSLASGSHSLKAVFVEDDYNLGNETSPVTVTVSKRTPTLSLSSSSSSATVGDSFTLSGTLSVGSGQSLLLYRNDHYVETLTTGSNGSFSKTLSESTVGSYSYYVLFESTSVYSRVQSASVSVSVHDVAPAYDDIVLTADDSILSYYDSDSTTLRAQLMDGTSTASVSGVTVEFFNGSTSLGTAQTDSNGVATKTYTSTGAGDISLTASDGTLSSETYTIHDYWYYNSTTYSTSSATLNVALPSHFQLEYDLTPTTRNNSAPYLDIGSASNSRALVGQYARAGTNGIITYTGSQTNHPHSNLTTLNSVNAIKFVYTGGDYTYSLNDSPMTVANANISFSKIIHIESGDGGRLTNIRVTKL